MVVAGRATAQQADSRLERLDAATRPTVAALVDSAHTAMLPTEPLVQRALEGATKRASGDAIVAAVRRLAADLGHARDAPNPVRPAPAARHVWTASLAAATSVFGVRASAAQTTATVDVGVSTVRYDGFLASAAGSLTPALTWERPGAVVTARGTYLRFDSGRRSLQGLIAASLFTPPSLLPHRWRGELSLSAGGSDYADFASFWHATGEARLHYVGADRGARIARSEAVEPRGRSRRVRRGEHHLHAGRAHRPLDLRRPLSHRPGQRQRRWAILERWTAPADAAAPTTGHPGPTAPESISCQRRRRGKLRRHCAPRSQAGARRRRPAGCLCSRRGDRRTRGRFHRLAAGRPPTHERRRVGERAAYSERRAPGQRADRRREVDRAGGDDAHHRRVRRGSRDRGRALTPPAGECRGLRPPAQRQHRPYAARRSERQQAHAPAPPNPGSHPGQQIDRETGQEEPQTRLERERSSHELAWRQLAHRGRELRRVRDHGDAPDEEQRDQQGEG